MYNILIVDDEEKHVSATMKYLKSNGFNTLGATDVNEALYLTRTKYPDLIIVDIMMPELDGYTFIKILQEDYRFKTIPFIFLTAKGMTQDRIKGYELGCSGYIPKPFDPDELIAIINNILTRKKEKITELLVLMEELKNLRTDLEIQYNLSIQLREKLSLTQKESIILKYVLEGLKNKEIASILNLSLRNIEKYVTKLLSKTGTRSRISLVNYCFFNINTLKANDGIRTRE